MFWLGGAAMAKIEQMPIDKVQVDMMAFMRKVLGKHSFDPIPEPTHIEVMKSKMILQISPGQSLHGNNICF